MRTLTKEEKKQMALMKALVREQARKDREHKRLVNRELKVLRFMKKTGVLYYHHGKSDKVNIDPVIKEVKGSNQFERYEWTTRKCEPFCHLGYKFRSDEFESIYDVPLDGTYRFQSYDSGERGLGAKCRLTAIRVEAEAYVPYVNPGAIFPITAK